MASLAFILNGLFESQQLVRETDNKSNPIQITTRLLTQFVNVDGLSGHAVSAVAQSTNLNDVIIVGREDELHRGNVSGHCVNLSMSVPCVRNLENGTTKKAF